MNTVLDIRFPKAVENVMGTNNYQCVQHFVLLGELFVIRKIKGKGIVHPITGHEGPEGE